MAFCEHKVNSPVLTGGQTPCEVLWPNWFLAVLSWRVLLIWILINLFYSWQVLLLLQFWQFGDLYCLIVELKRTDYGINSIFDMCRYCRSSWLNMDTCRYEAWSQCWDETKLGEITGIARTTWDATNDDTRYYNLHGQRVRPTSRGLYIRNGRKVAR